MSAARDAALAALTEAIESRADVARIVHLAAQLADAELAEAMASRATIEQAKGIIMGERRCTPDAAFDVLRQLSHVSNQKLHDLAQALVDSACEKPTSADPSGERL